MDLSLSSLTDALESSVVKKKNPDLFRKNGGFDMNNLKFATTTTRTKTKTKKKCEVLQKLEAEGCLNDEALMRDIREHKKKLTKKQKARAASKLTKKKKKLVVCFTRIAYFFFESAKIFHLPHFFLSADTQPAGLNAADFFERVRRHTHIAAVAFFVFDEDDEYWWYYQ